MNGTPRDRSATRPIDYGQVSSALPGHNRYHSSQPSQKEEVALKVVLFPFIVGAGFLNGLVLSNYIHVISWLLGILGAEIYFLISIGSYWLMMKSLLFGLALLSLTLTGIVIMAGIILIEMSSMR